MEKWHHFENWMNYIPLSPQAGKPLLHPLPAPGIVDLPRLGLHTQPQGPTLRDVSQLSPCPSSLFRLGLVFSLHFLPLLSPTWPKSDPLVAVYHFSRTFYHFSRTFSTGKKQLEADEFADIQRTKCPDSPLRREERRAGHPFSWAFADKNKGVLHQCWRNCRKYQVYLVT